MKKLRVFLYILLLGCILIILYFLIMDFNETFSDKYYKSGVLDAPYIESKYYDKDFFTPLYDVSNSLAKYGYNIYPVNSNETSYNYDNKLLIRMITDISDDSRVMILRSGGDMEGDIKESMSYIYDFVGKTNPKYIKKVSEVGNVNGYGAKYSEGMLETGNFFKKNPIYICAMDFNVKKDASFIFIYSCYDPLDLKNAPDLIKALFKEMVKDGL